MSKIPEAPATDTVFHETETGLKFSQITIRKLSKNIYLAEFKIIAKVFPRTIDVSISGTSIGNCTTRTEKFLDTKLSDAQINVIV
jgi:hypothetical protein